MTVQSTGPISEASGEDALQIVSVTRTSWSSFLDITLPSDVDDKDVYVVVCAGVLSDSLTGTLRSGDMTTANGWTKFLTYAMPSSRGDIGAWYKHMSAVDAGTSFAGPSFALSTTTSKIYRIRFNKAPSLVNVAHATALGANSGSAIGSQTINVSAQQSPIFKCGFVGGNSADNPMIMSGTLATNGVYTQGSTSDAYEFQNTGLGVNRTVAYTDTTGRRGLGSVGLNFA